MIALKISPSKITVPEIKDHDKNDRGVLAFFVSLLDLTKYKFFGFVINPLEDLRSIRFCLHDANENSTCRYYADIRNNIDNFILLTLSGFNNQNFEPNLIKKINLIIPTSDKFHVKEFKIKIKKFLVFKNNIELFNFVMSNDFFFPEQPYD